MKIGDEVYIHGYIDEIRNDTVIIKNDSGYFGTVEPEVVLNQPESCGDVVSRQVAIDTLLKWMRPICINNLGEVVESDDMVAIRNILKSLPSAQPERPKGKWIWELDEGDPSRSRMLVCSICGSRRDEVGTYNFCNICGAKMINPRGEQDG